jgi:anti-sigma B factor antagonist
MNENKASLTTERVANICIVSVRGSVDRAFSQDLWRTLEQWSNVDQPCIVVDCTHLTYINSSSCGMFFHFHRICEERNGRLALCGLQEKILAMLKMLGLQPLLHITETREQALIARSNV